MLCCDTLPENARVVRGVVLDLARRIDPGLADWIASECRFPSTMADPVFAAVVRRLWRDAIIPALTPPPGVDLSAHAEQVFAR